MRLPELEPGTWADWANAAATALAFTVALVLFIIGLRDRRRADEDRRLAADDRLRDQARKVWMWPVSWEVDRLGPIKNILYKITNDSDDPISDCQVSVKGPALHLRNAVWPISRHARTSSTANQRAQAWGGRRPPPGRHIQPFKCLARAAVTTQLHRCGGRSMATPIRRPTRADITSKPATQVTVGSAMAAHNHRVPAHKPVPVTLELAWSAPVFGTAPVSETAVTYSSR